ncbi:MAG: hypothetical protein M1822_007262 [Bathelium mastoideum]|nr:MAG: hypothetical protein M1822_007262 [Bathelium mastoideum]
MESTNTACFAPGWTSNVVGMPGFNTWTGSPICPSGQSVVTAFVSFSRQTTAICCSSNWGLELPDLMRAINPNSSVVTLTAWLCESDYASITATVINEFASSPVTAVTTAGAGYIASQPDYAFVYNAQDLKPPRSTNSTSSSGLITSAPQEPTGKSANEQGAGLNRGAQAGIGIGAVLCLGLLLGFLFWIWSLKRRKARVIQAVDSLPELEAKQEPRVELTGLGMQEVDGQGLLELIEQGLQELSGVPIVVELETLERAVELPGD